MSLVKRCTLIADALLIAYLATLLSATERELVENIDVTFHTALHDTDLSINKLRNVMSATNADPVLSQLRELIRHWFPVISLCCHRLRDAITASCITCMKWVVCFYIRIRSLYRMRLRPKCSP